MKTVAGFVRSVFFVGAKTLVVRGRHSFAVIVWGSGLLAPGTAGTEQRPSAIFAAHGSETARSIAITDTPCRDNAKLR